MSLLHQNADDTRVMALVFDNSRFESNAKRSISTLERLKGALAASQDVSAKAVDAGKWIVGVNDLEKSVSTVEAKFSTLTSITNRFKENVADDVYNTLKRTLKGMTVDQLSEGWEKYANKTRSVQTIMAATSKDFVNQAQQMAYVNDQLEKLNWFTDETSYDFVDMTDNIGKFMNAGVKLDDAVTAMEGIANWAAISGAGIQQASRAMYNLSQAMGTGRLALQDWMSIENAQMATMEFKETVLQTGVELGQLKEVADGVYEALDGTTITAQTFRDELKNGWLTSDLLVGTLKKYGDFTDALNKSLTRLHNNIGTSEMLRYIDEFIAGELDLEAVAEDAEVSVEFLRTELEELSKEQYDFGRKALKAAQEATTLEDALVATNDAASSTWMNIYETLFGNYLNQKGLWTDLAEKLWEAFVEPISDLGDAIESAFEKEAFIGEEQWAILTEAGLASPTFIDRIIAAGKKFGYITDDMVVEAEKFEESLDQGWFTSDLFDKIFNYKDGMLEFSEATENGITDVRQFAKLAEELRDQPTLGDHPDEWLYDFSEKGFNETGYKAFVDSIVKQYEAAKEANGGMAMVTDEMIENAEAALLSIQMGRDVKVEEAKDIIEALNAERTSYEELGIAIEGFAKTTVDADGNVVVLRKTAGEYWGETLRNAIDSLVGMVKMLTEEFGKVFGVFDEMDARDLTVNIWEAVGRFKEWVETSKELRAVVDAVFGLFKIKGVILKQVGGGILNVVDAIFGLFGKKSDETESTLVRVLGYVNKFADFLSESNIIGSVFEFIANSITQAGGAIKYFFSEFDPSGKVLDTLDKFKKGFFEAFMNLGTFLGGLTDKFGLFGKKIKDLGGIHFGNLAEVFNAFKETVLDYITNFDGFQTLKDAFGSLKDIVKGALKSIGIDVDDIYGVFTGVENAGKTGLGMFTKGVYDAFNAIKEFFKGIAESEFVTNNLDRFKKSFKDFGDRLGPWFDKLSKGFDKFKSDVKDLGNFNLGNLPKMIQSFYDNVIKAFFDTKPLESFGSAFKGLFEDINEWLKSIGIDIPGFIDSVIGKIDAFKTKVDELGGFKVENIGQILDMLVNSITKAITDSDWFALITGMLDDVKTTIIDWFTGLGVDLESIWEGIKNGFYQIVKFIAGIFGVELETDTSDTENQISSLTEKIDKATGSTIAMGEALGGVINDTMTNSIDDNPLLSGLMSMVGIVNVSADELEESGGKTKGVFAQMQESISKFVNSIKSFKLPPWLKQLKDDILGLAYAFLVYKTVSNIANIVDSFNTLKASMAKAMDRTSMLLIAGSIAILVGCVFALAQIPFESVMLAELAVGILAVAFVGLFAIFKKVAGSGTIATRAAISMMSIAAAIGILSILCYALGNADIFQLAKGAGIAIVGLGLVLLMLVSMSQIAPVAVASAKSAIIIIGSIGMFALISWALSNADPLALAKGAAELMAALGAIVLLFIFMDKVGVTYGNHATKSIKEIGVAMIALAGAMFILQFLNPKKAGSIILGLVGVMSSIMLLMWAANKWSNGMKKTGQTFKNLGILIGIMTAAILVLGFLPVNRVLQGIVAMGAIVLLIDSIIFVASKLGSDFAKMGKSFLLLGVTIGIIAGVIILMSTLGGDQLLTAAASLAIGMGSLLAALVVMGLVGKYLEVNWKSIGQLAVLGLIMGIVGFVIGLISRFGGDQLIEAATALTIGMGALVGAGLLIGVLGMLAPMFDAGLAAIGKLALVLLAIGAIEGLIDAIAGDSTGGITWLLEKAGEALEAFGSALGKFFGGIIGGVQEGYASHLEDIGTFLNAFQEVIGDIDVDKIQTGFDAIKKLSESIGSVGWDSIGAAFANALGSETTYNSDGSLNKKDIWTLFEERAKKIAEALTSFQTEMNKVGSVTIPETEIDALCDAIRSLPFNKGGIFSIFGKDVASEEDVDEFKRIGVKMAQAISDFSDALPDSFDSQKVTQAAYALKTLGDLGNVLNNVVWTTDDAWTGHHEGTYESFEKVIGGLGDAIAEFSKKDFNSEGLLSAANATKDIASAVRQLVGLKLDDSPFSDKEKVNTFTKNVKSTGDTFAKLTEQDFKGAGALADSILRLNYLNFSGDLMNEEIRAQFMASVEELTESLATLAGEVGRSNGSNILGSLFGGISEGGAENSISLDSIIGSVSGNGSFNWQDLLGSTGTGAPIDAGMIFGGIDFSNVQINNPEDLLTKLNGALGDSVELPISGFDTSNLDIGSLLSDITKNNNLDADTVGNMLTSLNSEIPGLTLNVDSLSVDGKEGNPAEMLGSIMSMAGMDYDGEAGTLPVNIVASTDDTSSAMMDEYLQLLNGGTVTANANGLVQAQIDTTAIESAIDSLKSSNASAIGEVSRSVDAMSARLDTLADAINSIDLVLNTGTLVGEITPMVNRELGGLLAQ